MSDRAGIFDESEFDVEGFAPKPAEKKTEVSAEAVRAVSENANFRSREPAAPKKEKKAEPVVREPRRHRTGRNVQLSLKVRSTASESFYAIADGQGWVLGETFERAIDALKRELAADRPPK